MTYNSRDNLMEYIGKCMKRKGIRRIGRPEKILATDFNPNMDKYFGSGVKSDGRGKRKRR